MHSSVLEELKKLKQKIQDTVAHKNLYDVLFTDSKEIGLFNNCISSIKNTKISEEELGILQGIYEDSGAMFSNIFKDWKNNQNSLSSEKIDIHYQNLRSLLEIVTLIKELNEGSQKAFVFINFDEFSRDIESLQGNMKKEVEKRQQQRNAVRKKELEEKAKEEFGKYVGNGTVDAVSIAEHTDQNLLHATIKLKDSNKSTDIKISEFLNDDFCKKNNIAGFLILNGNQEKIIHGFVDKEFRHYDLGTTAQYGIRFNWYVGGRECTITLGANSDGSIRVIGDRPTDKDLEENGAVRINVGGGNYLSLAEAVKTCKQKRNEAPSEHLRPVQTPVQCFPTFQEISNCSHNT